MLIPAKTGRGDSGAGPEGFIAFFRAGDVFADTGFALFSAFFFFIAISYHHLFPTVDTQSAFFCVEVIRYREIYTAPITPDSSDCATGGFHVG